MFAITHLHYLKRRNMFLILPPLNTSNFSSSYISSASSSRVGQLGQSPTNSTRTGTAAETLAPQPGMQSSRSRRPPPSPRPAAPPPPPFGSRERRHTFSLCLGGAVMANPCRYRGLTIPPPRKETLAASSLH
jgi:hypothetical protein